MSEEDKIALATRWSAKCSMAIGGRDVFKQRFLSHFDDQEELLKPKCNRGNICCSDCVLIIEIVEPCFL